MKFPVYHVSLLCKVSSHPIPVDPLILRRRHYSCYVTWSGLSALLKLARQCSHPCFEEELRTDFTLRTKYQYHPWCKMRSVGTTWKTFDKYKSQALCWRLCFFQSQLGSLWPFFTSSHTSQHDKFSVRVDVFFYLHMGHTFLFVCLIGRFVLLSPRLENSE